MFDDFQDFDEEEGSFEAPAPEGLQPPRNSILCLGHESIEKKLLDYINSGAVPHALIFSGLKGTGKSTMAFRLARYLLKNGTPDAAQDSLFGEAPSVAESLSIPEDDSIFSQVSSGGHPDLLTIERPMDSKKGQQKTALDVETARKVAPFLRMTSSNGGWRVVIVDDADTMNRNAQNALLKILEEPPKDALLILICHRLGAMIPTIRSRCRVLNFESLSTAHLSDLMEREIGSTLESEQKFLLSALSNGSIGTAKEIIDNKGLDIAESVLEIIQTWPKFNWVDIHHLSDQVGRAGQDEAFINLERTLLWLCEKMIFVKAKNRQNLERPLEKPVYTDILNTYDLQTWLEIFEKLQSHFSQAHFSNLDKRQAALEAFNLIKPV